MRIAVWINVRATFIDTSVVKHSIRKKTVLRPRPPKQVRFGNTAHESIVHCDL